MPAPSRRERAVAALIGAWIGDALALGPHWYYDLAALRRDYGEWISDYMPPRPGRYHAGLPAGHASQAGYILLLTVRSLVECGGYDEADFCRRLDTELLALIDGTPMQGPGGYTSQSIRDVWHRRVGQGLPWGQVAGHADTTEAIERGLALALRYAEAPQDLARAVADNTRLTQDDEIVVAMSVAYAAVLAALVRGEPFDRGLSGKLMRQVESGELPFHAVTTTGLQPPAAGAEPTRAGRFASPDALLTPSCIAAAVADADIRIEPAWKVSLVYGMPCAIYHQLPAAYYLAARYGDDFEAAVLHAVNGGGQNQARAMLTAALVGAQVGLAGIPERWLRGLLGGEERLDLAWRLVAGLSDQV